MPRTTSDEVKAVLAPGGDYDTRRNPSLLPFIKTASLLVDDVVAVMHKAPYSDVKLEMIECWLAAHFYKQSDKDFSSRSTQGASGSFAGKTDMGLESTLYGQSALALDSKGYLAEVSTGTIEATGVWLGKPNDQQREYYDKE